MPKTYNGLFEKICSFENLYAAYEEAKKQKRFKPDVLDASFNVEEIILNLHEKLLSETWAPGTYREFLCTSEVKRRVIHAPTFSDRIVHHALVRVVRPFFEQKFIYDSYAVTPGKGTHRAVWRVQKFVQRAEKCGDAYVLQCDIHHYYPSIDHNMLFTEISRTIRDKRVLWLWKKLLDGFNGESGVGLPIGALTSQLSANICLNILDHFVKECIGWKLYVRYMDDFILIGNSKEDLWKALADIRWLLSTKLRLQLNKKTRVYKASKGIDFAGYRTWPTHIRPRKRNVRAARRRFKKMSLRYARGEIGLDYIHHRAASFVGYMKHCTAKKTTQSTLEYLILRREN